MLKNISLALIGFYQTYARGTLPSSCRYCPSCSEYSRQAIIKYGFFRGLGKGLRRLASCHPWAEKSGYDPLI